LEARVWVIGKKHGLKRCLKGDGVMKRRLVTVKHPATSSEIDSLAVIRSVSEEGFRTGWKAGKKSLTKDTISRDRAALINKLPRNLNKRLYIVKNITFSVQKENENWIRLLSKKTLKRRSVVSKKEEQRNSE
jgi:hypothetical protein